MATLREAGVIGALVASAPVMALGHVGWIATWQTSPTGIPDHAAIEEIRRVSPEWNLSKPTTLQGTIRYRVRIAVGGRALRLALHNPYFETISLAGVSVAIAGQGLDAVTGTIREVRFGGIKGISISPEVPATSDSVDLAVNDGVDLLVSIHVPDPIPHWAQGELPPAISPALAEGSDRTLSERFSVSKHINQRPLLSRIDVSGSKARKVVVALGDSITDGVIAPDGERGWPGALARRLAAKNISVVNAGIGGNRLLQPFGALQLAGLARLDRDVFAVPGLTHIVLLEGINDIGMGAMTFGVFGSSPPVGAEELISAYRKIISRAHSRSVKVIIGTILPFEGTYYYSSDKEGIRQAVNAWIRTAKAFDGFIDFDSVMRDPTASAKLRAEYDSGDHLHPNVAGYRAMGEMIDLELFE